MIKQIPIGPMMNFAYLIGDDSSKVCAAVDPAWNAPEIARVAEESGWKIVKILLTHSHYDHINALEALAETTRAEVYVHTADAEGLPPGVDARRTEDGSEIEIGSLTARCIHTPGHTLGSQCFLVEGALITGDTLFIDNCGRVDLPESSPKQMIQSLARLAKLDPSTVVYPGHDYGPSSTSTIGEQIKSNPYLNAGHGDELL